MSSHSDCSSKPSRIASSAKAPSMAWTVPTWLAATALEVIVDGKWMSGVVDRMHVHRDAEGRAELVEVLDFKTDRVESPEELVERYGEQLEAYAEAVGAIFGEVEVRKRLVSTALRTVVEL